MVDFDDIFKLNQRHLNISKSFGLSSPLFEMINVQTKIANSLSGVQMMAELGKSIQQYHRIGDNPSLSAIEAITKNLSLHTKFVIPQTTIEAITSINRKHEELLGGLRTISEAFKIQSPAIAQIAKACYWLVSTRTREPRERHERESPHRLGGSATETKSV